MLTGVHFLLTYACNFECEHCFVYSGPRSPGTFTLSQLKAIMPELVRLGTVETVYFEGGEPCLYYPLLLEGIRLARGCGFRTGVVTNGYWATSVEDAELWLRPLQELGVNDVTVSDDAFHYGDEAENVAKRAVAAAKNLGLGVDTICIEKPRLEANPAQPRGAPVIGGGAMFRGRAAATLTEGLPTRPWWELDDCPYEDLRDPGRVHIDAYGHVHLCQGLSMGNLWSTPLSELVASYDGERHPVAGPLLRGGPAALARAYHVPHAKEYVDECHFCYSLRKALLDQFPEFLGPRQVYGLD